MRFFVIFAAVLLLAGCAVHPPPHQKLAIQGPDVSASPTFVARSSQSTIEARGLRIASRKGEEWVLHLAIEGADGRAPDVTAVYALGTPMPYTPFSADGAREAGYIPMSRDIFEALSETGFKVEILGGDKRLHVIEVPARTFAYLLG